MLNDLISKEESAGLKKTIVFSHKMGWLLLALALLLNVVAIMLSYSLNFLFHGWGNKVDVQYNLYLFLTGHYNVFPDMGLGKKTVVLLLLSLSHLCFFISLLLLTYHQVKRFRRKTEV